MTIQREGVGGNYIPAAGALIPSGNYTVTAAGVFNGITSTIYVVVPVGSDFQVDFKSLQWRKQNT